MNHCPNQQPMNFSQNSLLKEYPALLTNPLFFGLSEEEFLQSIQKLSGITRSYEKGALIYHMGDVVQAMGILLKGQTLIESTDPWGNRTILSSLEAGDYFAETYALLPQEPLMVDVSVSEPALVLFLNLHPVSTDLPYRPEDHPRTTFILPLLAGCPAEFHVLYDSIFQTTTGGLPECRPQRVICRTWEDEAGRTD